MKSALPFFGVRGPDVRKVTKELAKPLQFESFAEFERFVRFIWNNASKREERYAALTLLDIKQTRAFQTMDAVPLYEFLISDGAWWDVVDEVANHRFVKLLEDERDAMVKVLRRWSKSKDLWLRRSAIIAQVLRHEATELELMFELIEPAIHENEFFLRKAIGWALRSAGKEFPREIRAYVDKNSERLSGLSKREAEKSLSKNQS
jgi:3-methyladenine DNA glycosylase AlkD